MVITNTHKRKLISIWLNLLPRRQRRRLFNNKFWLRPPKRLLKKRPSELPLRQRLLLKLLRLRLRLDRRLLRLLLRLPERRPKMMLRLPEMLNTPLNWLPKTPPKKLSSMPQRLSIKLNWI